MRQSTETLQDKEKEDKTSNEMSDGEKPFTTELFVSTADGMESPQTKGQSHSRSGDHNVAKHGVSFVLQ